MSDVHPGPSVVLQWIPEDDLLLKNSVEHGASLEALAKGAVRFSRKFSVEELQHRWYSLLYDPDISADASSRMVEMEHSACNTSSKLNRSGNSKENEDVSLKRKFESVQQLYYSMRKKTCHQPLNSAESPVYSHITGDAAAANVVFGITNACHTHDPNSIQDDQKAVLREHDNIELLEKDPITINSPTRKGRGHPISGDERPKDFPHSVEGVPLNLGIGRGVQDMEHSNASHDGSVSFRIGGYLSPSPRMPLWELTENISGPAVPVNMNVRDEDQGVGRSVVPDGVREQGYLLDCSMEDQLIYGNADGKHTADMLCYDSLNSLLSTSPNDANGNIVLDDKEPQAAPNTNFATFAGINAEELEVDVGPSHSTPDFPKPHDRLLNCTLNSEDPEIPSNDDVFLHRPFTTSLAIIVSKEASNPISVFASWEACDQLHLTNREEIPSKSLVTTCMPDNYLPLASHGIKSEFPNSNCHHMLSRIASRNQSQLRSALANPSFASDGVFDGSLSSRFSSDTPVCAIGTIKGLLRPKATAPTTDHEESDDDIPYFSDIEAMMLQMDLSPDDEDSNVLEKVSRYQHEDTKKTIIRLEQCAHSSMQRAIASKGAFAILHGRHLKHYIKETEVILGRATDETDVDIDLRREGCANKISRRQAFIRMGEDGSFFLKNLGKSSMFVNGKEVTTGQHMNLSPSCLIEMSNGKFADQGIGICV